MNGSPRTAISDRQRFEELYLAFWPRIFGYVRARVDDRADAEDITAEVFLRAYQAYHRFEPRHGSPAPWLFTIARHACLDYLGRLAMRARLIRVLTEEDEPMDPAAIVERRLDYRRVRHEVALLPPRQQEALHLFHGRGLSFNETAARLQCSEDAAKMLCHRGLKALRLRVPAA